MQVFKTFMKVMKKNLHVSLIYIVIFVAIGFMMGATTKETGDYENAELGMTVIDMDNSEASKVLIKYIESKHNLVDIENDKDKIIDALYYYRTDYVLIINEGYSEKLFNGETDNLFQNYKLPDSYDAIFIETQLDEYVRVVNSYVAGGLTVAEATAKPMELDYDVTEVEMVSFTDNIAGKTNNQIAFYYQYLPFIFISVLINALGTTLMIMRKKDMRNRTNCSCVSATSQMKQTMAGTTIFIIGLYVLLTIASFIIYGKDILNHSGLLAMLNGFVFLLVAMMITLLVSILASSTKVISMIANVIGLGMSFLCGVFVQQYLLSKTVLSFSKFLPAYWYIKANNMIFGMASEIFTMQKYITYIGIQLAFCVALFCVILLLSKVKQKSKSI